MRPRRLAVGQGAGVLALGYPVADAVPGSVRHRRRGDAEVKVDIFGRGAGAEPRHPDEGTVRTDEAVPAEPDAGLDGDPDAGLAQDFFPVRLVLLLEQLEAGHRYDARR